MVTPRCVTFVYVYRALTYKKSLLSPNRKWAIWFCITLVLWICPCLFLSVLLPLFDFIFFFVCVQIYLIKLSLCYTFLPALVSCFLGPFYKTCCNQPSLLLFHPCSIDVLLCLSKYKQYDTQSFNVWTQTCQRCDTQWRGPIRKQTLVSASLSPVPTRSSRRYSPKGFVFSNLNHFVYRKRNQVRVDRASKQWNTHSYFQTFNFVHAGNCSWACNDTVAREHTRLTHSLTYR